MATEILFTQTKIGKLPVPASGRAYYRDSRMPGLWLCVLSSGSRIFEYCRWIRGRSTRLTIGRHPAITVAQARQEVTRLSGLQAAGVDPAEDRRKKRREPTFGELWTHYLEIHAKPHKRSWREDQRQYDAYLASWSNRRLGSIDKADVQRLHALIGAGEHPHQVNAVKEKSRRAGASRYAANRLLALLSAIFSYAADLGFHGESPTRDVERFEERERDRFMQIEEVRRFLLALESADPLWRDFFKVALLTGARRANVQAMRWLDLELARGLWRVPGEQSKSGEPLILVLVPAVVEILNRRAEQFGTVKEYVFASWGKSGHITEPKGAWRSILQAAALSDLRMHDLRRTLGSWQAIAGTSTTIIGRSLGHKSIQATAIYARLNLDPVRASMNAATSALLDTIAAKPESPKVLPSPPSP